MPSVSVFILCFRGTMTGTTLHAEMKFHINTNRSLPVGAVMTRLAVNALQFHWPYNIWFSIPIRAFNFLMYIYLSV